MDIPFGEAKIQIVIATFNQADSIGETLDSIQTQNYPAGLIYTYIVDFGSTDGTYEKLLQYDRYHLAVFQLGQLENRRYQMAEAAKFVYLEPAGGQYCYTVTLRAGDILYPDFLKVCSEVMLKNRGMNPQLLLCEADVKEHGSVKRQTPIFHEKCSLYGADLPEKMIGKHGHHYLGYFGGKLFTARHRFFCLGNDRCFLDQSIFNCEVEDYVLYIPETLICLEERTYENEAEELLINWESIIQYQRRWDAKSDYKMEAGLQNLLLQNLAKRGLWRIYKRRRELFRKELEDLLYLIEIMAYDTLSLEIYQHTKRMALEEDQESLKFCEEYYARRDARNPCLSGGSAACKTGYPQGNP